MSVSFAPARQYANRSLVIILVLGMVNLAVPASARASTADDVTSSAVTSNSGPLAPGVFERSIAAEASRAALQEPQTGTGEPTGSHTVCRTGGVLLVAAGVAFATAVVKHAHWASSAATALPGAKPPSSVAISVSIGAVLAGASIVMMSRGCGE